MFQFILSIWPQILIGVIAIVIFHYSRIIFRLRCNSNIDKNHKIYNSNNDYKYNKQYSSNIMQDTNTVDINGSFQKEKKILILYTTLKGTSRMLAHKLYNKLMIKKLYSSIYKKLSLKQLNEVDPELLTQEDIVIYILPTYEGGLPPDNATQFHTLLEDMSNDFRYGTLYLKHVHFSIFGLGDKAYGESKFNIFAKKTTNQMKKLGAYCFCKPIYSSENQVDALFNLFITNIMKYLV